ncbi:MAG: transposase [Shimia sp.]|nr:transposase [Shimia sp.]
MIKPWQKHGKRCSEEQIIRILDEVRGGKAIAEVARRYGVSENTIYRWKSRFGEMNREELRRLRELEAENARLKRIVAQQALDIDALKDGVRKKWQARWRNDR